MQYISSAYQIITVSYTHLRAHETVLDLVCRLLLEKNITWIQTISIYKQLSNLESKRPWIFAWGLSTQLNIGIKDQRFISAMGSGRTVRGFSYPNRLTYYDEDQSYRFGFNNYSTSIELRKIVMPRTVMLDRYEFGATIAGFIDYGAANQDEFSKLFNSKGILGTGLSFQLSLIHI